MPLELDTRQRAMLEAMGIAVWLPGLAPAAAHQNAPDSVANTLDMTTASGIKSTALMGGAPTIAQQRGRLAPAAMTSPLKGPAARTDSRTDGASYGVGFSNGPGTAGATTNSTTASWTLSPPQLLFNQTDPADSPASLGRGWLLVAEPAPGATPADPFAGDAGRLLSNMLRAMQLHRHPRVYLAMLVPADAASSASGHSHSPAASGLSQALEQAIAHTQPALVLVMGRVAAQALMQSTEPLGRLRGAIGRLPGVQADVPSLVTYDAPYLLRAQPDKARAWADLCLALLTVQQAQSPAA